MMFDGEVAWVTGSSTGIGRAVATGLAEQGCRVVVHYNRSEDEAREVVEEISSSGGEAALVGGDVADAGEVKRMVGEIEDRHGRLDILVNNAGSLVERRTLEEMSEDLWERVMDVNLKSVYLCSQAVLPMMKRQGKGRIINMTSVAARNGGTRGSVAYATAKGGVSTLTRAMAKELVGVGILVNGVAPASSPRRSTTASRPPRCAKRWWAPSPWDARARPRRPRGPCSFWPRLGRITWSARSSRSTAAS